MSYLLLKRGTLDQKLDYIRFKVGQAAAVSLGGGRRLP